MKPLAVEVLDLCIRFGDFLAVDRVSFQVAQGEVFGFLGANGAGKTTTIRVLCGLLVPSSGSARVAGLGFEDMGRAIKAKVGYMSQRFTLYNDLTVAENLDFAAGLRKLDESFARRRTKELLEFIEFSPKLGTLVGKLPGGIKQELALAAAILHDPELVFLDEPTAGVEPASRVRFWQLIRKLTSAGKTVIVTTHYMDEAERCDRIALMRTGRLIALDSPQGLKTRAFPGPVFELDAQGMEVSPWIEALRSSAGILSVMPYGMRFHACADSQKSWDAVSIPSGVMVRQIAPSLEDVFLKLVQGEER